MTATPGVRYVFLATEGFPDTVYRSQVADLLQVLSREAGLQFELINFDPLYLKTRLSRQGRTRLAELSAAVPGKFSVRPYVPYEDRFGVPLARRILGRDLAPKRPTVVHARGVWAAAMAARMAERRRWIKVLYDVRGDYVAEHAHHHTGRGTATSLWVQLGQWRIGRAEARVCRAATRILCVSQSLRRLLEGRYPGAGVKALVVPSGYDPAKFRWDPELRRTWRQRLGLADAFVIAYTGSLVAYQLPKLMARLGAEAVRRNPNVHLLYLTPHREAARRSLHEAGVASDRYTCLTVDHDAMIGPLNAADLGLLLRRPDPVNRVASPTKGGEYLACGVPLLASAGIGDLSDLIQAERLGTIVNEIDDVALLASHLDRWTQRDPQRDRISRVARDRLARDRFLPTYLDVYTQLANAAQRGLDS